MTPRELYEWAEDNRTEDCNMVFTLDVGNQEVELDIYELIRTGSRFEMQVKLY